MDGKQQAVLLFTLVIAVIGGFVLLARMSFKPVQITTSVSGAGPGWVNITLNSNLNLKTASLSLARPAKLLYCKNTTCLFKYWVAPADESGNYTGRLLATTDKNKTLSFNLPIYIKNSVNFTRINGIVFYGDNPNETFSYFNTTNITVVGKFTRGDTPGNGAVVRAEIVLIAGLVAMNKSVTFFASSPTNCTLTIPGKDISLSFPASKCDNLAGPRIIIDQPIYPTDQVYLKNDTIQIQSTPEDIKQVSSDLIYALARYLKNGTLT